MTSMRGKYHVHDNRPLICNGQHPDNKPRVYYLNGPRACSNPNNKRYCNGTPLGILCMLHMRPITDVERDVLLLQGATVIPELVPDPRPMRYAA